MSPNYGRQQWNPYPVNNYFSWQRPSRKNIPYYTGNIGRQSNLHVFGQQHSSRSIAPNSVQYANRRSAYQHR